MFNYGSRNGVGRIITLTKLICRIYTRYATRIVAYVDASTLDSGQKTTVKNWLASAQDACMILETIEFVYE